MESIIDALFLEYCQMDELSKNQNTILRAEYAPMCDRIQSAFGLEFIDRFAELHAQIHDTNRQVLFRHGFYTGANLMLELLTRTPTSSRP